MILPSGDLLLLVREGGREGAPEYCTNDPGSSGPCISNAAQRSQPCSDLQ
jgi:hypothetical protein